MYLWRRLASQKWWSDNEDGLHARAGNRLATIERSGRKRLQLEVSSPSRMELQRLTKQFGGRIEKLPRDWLKRFSREQKTEPIRIGKRLVIVRSAKDRQSTKELIITVATAFGTAEHATTAMSLRMLEKLTRRWKPGWSIVDLGTGTGILALAAKCFGANRVIGIDNDPTAISTAKANARANKIQGMRFLVGDVRRWRFPRNIDIVAGNLFSELLIETLPKLKAGRWMILSGILSNQERGVTHALRRHKIDIVQVRRRGKWVAILTAVR
ncbi:MAG TPA: 50S ribosomal protein L11 methyltransferase [Chthoniobacterales bacterium]|jgi:ribosomal protein L11 methyltransferase|nr:50S ribosomal protein L11 methyltransferase [Chthoniobacterales bacterium]